MTIATLLALILLPGGVEFLAPAADESVTGEVAIELQVDPGTDWTRIRLTVDGELITELEAPVLGATWRAQGPTRRVELVADVDLVDGRTIQARRLAQVIRIDQTVDVDLFLTPVVVVDAHGRPVAGLTEADFALRVDGRATAIEHFEGGDSPFSIAILIDCSSSMVGERFHAARTAARTLVDRLGPRDRALLIGFDHRARLDVPLTSDKQALARGLDELHTGGGTSLFDALELGIRRLSEEPGRKALVVLSDGEDAMSSTSPGALERAARRSQVVLYPVWVAGTVNPLDDADDQLGRDARRLRALADEVGGRALFPRSPAELVEAYAAVFQEMRNQYTIGFIPPAPRAGRSHRIQVDARVESVRVRARTGWLD